MSAAAVLLFAAAAVGFVSVGISAHAAVFADPVPKFDDSSLHFRLFKRCWIVTGALVVAAALTALWGLL